MHRYPAVVQIRNGSSRLPGKALLPILGRPVIDYLVDRVAAVPSVSRILIATTESAPDDRLAEHCQRMGLQVFRGDEEDVLSRICQCVGSIAEPYFVKFWGDSPLVDVDICEAIIRTVEGEFADYDYVSNNHPSTYPEGLQIEVIRTTAFRELCHVGELTEFDRQHVTPPFWQNPGRYSVGNLEHPLNLHDAYRIVIDYPEDFEQVRAIIEALYPREPLFGMEAMVRFLDEHPEVKMLNAAHYESESAYYSRVGASAG